MYTEALALERKQGGTPGAPPDGVNVPRYQEEEDCRQKRQPLQWVLTLREQFGTGWYDEYLRTPWWKNKRHQKLTSVNWRCERCNARAEQVHHKHYNSLGREKNCDLEALCDPCHNREHGL